MDVSIIIPTYNGRSLLGTCLPSVRGALRAAEGCATEILVVDDASTDGTAEWLAREHPEVRCIRRERNGGFAAAVNAGFAAARGRWVALVNNDVVLDPDWLRAAGGHFADEGLGAIATCILRAEDPALVDTAGDEYTVVGIPIQWGNGRPVSEVAERRMCFSGCGAAVLYRRAALEAVGGLYEALGAYCEDVELGYRLQLGGYACLYEPAARCVHLGSASYGRASYRQKFNSARNAEIVYFTCTPRALLWRYAGAWAAARAMHVLHHASRGTLGPYLRGKAAFLSQLTAVRRRRGEVQRARRIGAADLLRRMDRRWFRHLILWRCGWRR